MKLRIKYKYCPDIKQGAYFPEERFCFMWFSIFYSSSYPIWYHDEQDAKNFLEQYKLEQQQKFARRCQERELRYKAKLAKKDFNPKVTYTTDYNLGD